MSVLRNTARISGTSKYGNPYCCQEQIVNIKGKGSATLANHFVAGLSIQAASSEVRSF